MPLIDFASTVHLARFLCLHLEARDYPAAIYGMHTLGIPYTSLEFTYNESQENFGLRLVNWFVGGLQSSVVSNLLTAKSLHK